MNAPVEYESLKPDDQFLISLGADVWLMDDHKWALLVWERYRKERGRSRYSLVHADFHWDGVDDFRDDEAGQTALLNADLEALQTMTRAGEGIQFDSFIAAAVRRSLLAEIHFYCLQDDGESGIDAQLSEKMGTRQFIHEDVKDLVAAKVVAPFIFDLCLDLFNAGDAKFGEGDLWADEDILKFIQGVEHLIRDAELVTVSMSFNYSGTEDDTRHLAGLVVPKLLALRSERPVPWV